VLELPLERDRSLAFISSGEDWPEAAKGNGHAGTIVGSFPDEEEGGAALGRWGEMPSSLLRGTRGYSLRLPMKAPPGEREVAIAKMLLLLCALLKRARSMS